MAFSRLGTGTNTAPRSFRITVTPSISGRCDKMEGIGSFGSRENAMVGHKIFWRGWNKSKELLRCKEIVGRTDMFQDGYSQ